MLELFGSITVLDYVPVRYLRITITATRDGGVSYPCIGRVALISTDGDDLSATPGAIVTAISQIDNARAATNAFKDDTTFWHPYTPGQPNWIQIDLLETKHLKEIYMRPIGFANGNAFIPRDFYIETGISRYNERRIVSKANFDFIPPLDMTKVYG